MVSEPQVAMEQKPKLSKKTRTTQNSKIMKLKQIILAVGTTLVSLVATTQMSRAVTFATVSINNSAPNPSTSPECSVVPCPANPGTTTTTLNLSATSSPQNGYRVNDSGFDIVGLSYLITGNDLQNFQWSSTGNTSDIFSQVQVLNNGTELLFTGGAIHPGQYFVATRTYDPTTNVSFHPIHSLEFAAVPEPSSTLGMLAFGAFSAGSLLKRRRNQRKCDCLFGGQAIPKLDK
jgi:hypothetical protein